MRASAGVLLCLAIATACGTSRPAPFAFDAGRVRTDGRDSAPQIDTDHDGLCDDTEADIRTNPALVDTDSDGLIDGFEYLLGSDPLTSLDPPSSERLVLPEGVDSTVISEQVLDYRSVGGEVVSASVLDRVRGLDGRVISEFAPATVLALDADPAAFVIAAAENRFVGVTGRVRLHWQARFRHDGSQLRPLGCRRAYSVLFVAKREGDQVVANRSLVLEVTPGDATPALDAGVSRWPSVDPEGQCLPRGPCL